MTLKFKKGESVKHIGLMVVLFMMIMAAAGNGQTGNEFVNKLTDIEYLPLPSVIVPEEQFDFKGCLKKMEAGQTVYAQLLSIDNQWKKQMEAQIRDGCFTLPLIFPQAGFYWFSVMIGSKPYGTLIVQVDHLPSVDQKPISSLMMGDLSIYSDRVYLNWSNQNELLDLKIRQNGKTVHRILSNTPQGYSFDDSIWYGFQPGKANFSIDAARSRNGSLYARCSDWSTLYAGEIELGAYEPVRLVKRVKWLDRNQQLSVPVGTKRIFQFEIEDRFRKSAYIATPSGRVEKLELKTSNPATRYSWGSGIIELVDKGSASLEYSFNQPGIYRIEINDTEGEALVNLPVFTAPIYPILKEDIATGIQVERVSDSAIIRSQVLTVINGIRGTLNYPLLRYDDKLNQLADYYSERMARDNFCSHIAPDNETLDRRQIKFQVYSPVYENISLHRSISMAFTGLTKSPAHFASFTDSAMTRIGVSARKDTSGYFHMAVYVGRTPYDTMELEKLKDDLSVCIIKSYPKLKRSEQINPASNKIQLNFKAGDMENLTQLVIERLKSEDFERYPWIYLQNPVQSITDISIQITLMDLK